MANLNKVFLIGNLTRDPELRFTPGGAQVAEFGLAVNRQYRTQAGEQREETAFLDIVVWGRQAETCNEYLSKGRPVLIEGRLQFDSWETQDGQRRNKIRIVAERVQFLGRAGDTGGAGSAGPRREAPRRAAPQPPKPSEPSVQEAPPDDAINLDDIPF